MDALWGIVICAGVCLISFVGGIGVAQTYVIREDDLHDQADKGLVFCKLGENYVWLTPEEFERLRMTDHE